MQDGQLGKITHAVIQFPGGGYGTPPEPEAPVPQGLNWELFQGPRPGGRSSRAACAGADGGTTAVDSSPTGVSTSRTWRCGHLNSQRVGPLLTSGTAQYVNFVNPDRDQSPDAFSVSWQYPTFVMTFTNAVVQDWEFGRQGNYFFGPGGSLLIHRAGYEVRPGGGGGRSWPRRSGRRERAGRAGRDGGESPAPPPPIQPRRVPWREGDGSDSNSSTVAHGRNFLDCVKSRNKPVSDLEIGFYASLPCPARGQGGGGGPFLMGGRRRGGGGGPARPAGGRGGPGAGAPPGAAGGGGGRGPLFSGGAPVAASCRGRVR